MAPGGCAGVSEGVDVTLVEGAVSSQEDLKKLQKIRSRTRTLVALGDCAVTSNVSAMRNGLPVQKMLAIDLHRRRVGSQGRADRWRAGAAPQARPVREFVESDLYLPDARPRPRPSSAF